MSREAIARTALAILDAEGRTALTVCNVATRLGVRSHLDALALIARRAIETAAALRVPDAARVALVPAEPRGS